MRAFTQSGLVDRVHLLQRNAFHCTADLTQPLTELLHLPAGDLRSTRRLWRRKRRRLTHVRVNLKWLVCRYPRHLRASLLEVGIRHAHLRSAAQQRAQRAYARADCLS